MVRGAGLGYNSVRVSASLEPASTGRPLAPPAPLPSSIALTALAVLALLAPWPFGSVHPLAVQVVATLALTAAAAALVTGAMRGLALLAVPLWPLVGLLGLGLAQLVPLPAPLHALLAPGTYAVWHPSEPAAAAVLGSGPHPVSVDPTTTLRALGLGAGLVLLALLAAPALARPALARRAAAAVTVGGLAVAAYGILARARFGSLLYGRFPVPTVSPFGPFVSKNHFAGYVEMAALLALGLAAGLAGRSRGRDWTTGRSAAGVVFALVSALAMALGVLVSFSRGGAASLLAGAIAFVGLRFGLRGESRAGRPLLPALAVAALLSALLLAILPPDAQERMRSLGGASFRLDTWRDAIRMSLTSPWLGQGLGSFHDAFPRFKNGHGLIRVEHAENDYLEMLAEGGFLGLALMIAAGAGLLARSWAGLRNCDRLVSGLATGALAGLVALGVHSAVDFNLRIPSNALLAAFLAAVAAAPAGWRPLSARGAWALSALPVALLGALLLLPAAPWLSAREKVRAAALAPAPEVQALRLERAERALAQTLRLRPAHAESWLLLAGIKAAQGQGAAAAALARHASALDPERADLRLAAEHLVRGTTVSAP